MYKSNEESLVQWVKIQALSGDGRGGADGSQRTATVLLEAHDWHG